MSLKEEKMASNDKMGTERIGKLLFRFSLPCVISLLISSLYNLVDQIFVGNSSLGYLGNAATGVVYPIVVVTQAFAWGFGDGCASFLAICQGKKETLKASKAMGTGISLTFVSSLFILLFSLFFSDPVLRFCGASETTLPMARSYLRILAFFFPCYMLQNMLNSIIRSDGSPNFAMITTGVGALLNIILDPIFIYLCDWGIEGAAWASAIGQAISFLLSALYFLKPKTFRFAWRDFLPDFKIYKEPLLLGASSFITQLSVVIINLVGNMVITKYGNLSIYGQDIPISTTSVETKVFSLVLNIVVGIALGSQPIIGYNLGAGKVERIRKTYWLILGWTLAIGAFSTLLFELYPEGVLILFGGKESELYVEYGKLVFRLFLATTILTCFIKMSSIFFQACGEPLKATASSLMRDILFFVPLVIILPMIAESKEKGTGVVALLYAPMIADLLAVSYVLFITIKLFKQLKKYDKGFSKAE